MLAPLKGADQKCFLTFSPEKNQVYHSTTALKCGKGPHGVAIIESAVPEWQRGTNRRHEFVGRFFIELFLTWPPSHSEYEDREDFFGRVVVSTHSNGADPKCFLTFSSEQSIADRTLHLPASGYQENSAKTAKPRSTHRPASKRRRHRGNVSQAEEPKKLNGVPEFSTTKGAITHEVIDETDTSIGKS